jgi:imidazoleglycerol phosphate dehydratase HisB
MKFCILPSFRLDRALRRAIENVLSEEETVARFYEEAIRLELARRQSLLDLTTNALVSINQPGRAGAVVDTDEVEEEFLFALVTELNTSAARAAAALDRTIQRLDESERRRSQLEAAARERAQHEFADLLR